MTLPTREPHVPRQCRGLWRTEHRVVSDPSGRTQPWRPTVRLGDTGHEARGWFHSEPGLSGPVARKQLAGG